MDSIQPGALVSRPGHQVKIGVCSFVPLELGRWSKQLPCLTERLRGFQQQRTSNSACSFKIRQNVLLQKNILFFISVFYKWLIKMLRGTGILPMFFPWGSLHLVDSLGSCKLSIHFFPLLLPGSRYRWKESKLVPVQQALHLRGLCLHTTNR